MDVQLKVNMILEKGAYLPIGAVVEEEVIPPNLRQSQYICPPGEMPDNPGLAALARQEADGSGDEPLPPAPPGRRRAA
jgi:hypothetical protein